MTILKSFIWLNPGAVLKAEKMEGEQEERIASTEAG